MKPRWMVRAAKSWGDRFPYIAFPLPYLGAGAVFAAFLNALHNYQIPDASGGPVLFPFVGGVMGGALVFGIAFALASALIAGHDESFLLRRGRKRIVLTISVICMLIGCTFLGVGAIAPETVPPVAYSIFGTILGIGTMAAAFLWGAVYARLEPQSALFAASASFAFACLFNCFVELVGTPLPNYIGCAILVCLGAYLLPIAAEFSGNTDGEASGTQAESTPLSGKDKAASAARQLWMPLVGALLATFIFGLTWDPAASGLPASREMITITLRSLAGPLITVAIIMGAVIRRPDSSVLRIVQTALFPIAIALLLALPTITSDNLSISALTALLDKASFSVIIVIIWTVVTNVSRTSQIPAHILLPLCFGILGGSSFLGLNLIHVIGTNGQTLCLVLFAIYLALIATSFALNSRAEKASIVVETVSPTKSIQQRSDEIALEYGLSPREIEVLYLLGRGYNHGYIGTRLFISENTVRTHVRHIYTKLEIASREELIELIDRVER